MALTFLPLLGRPVTETLLNQLSIPAGGSQFLLIDMVTGDSLVFGSYPEDSGHSASKTATYVGNKIIGRSSPVYGYSGSESQTFSISFQINASMYQSDGGTPEKVKEACDWLMSLQYPDYSGGLAKPPHKCFYKAGNQIQMTVLVRSVQISYLPPYDVATGLCYRAGVSLSLLEVEDDPKSYEEVRGVRG